MHVILTLGVLLQVGAYASEFKYLQLEYDEAAARLGTLDRLFRRELRGSLLRAGLESASWNCMHYAMVGCMYGLVLVEGWNSARFTFLPGRLCVFRDASATPV